jgi:predicted amidohydrolase
MKIAAIQMVSGTRLDDNLAAAARLLAEAAAQGCELAVLPEYFCFLGRVDTDKIALREPAGEGPIQAFLADRARALGLWVVGGTLPLVAGDAGRVRNASRAFSPRGERVARYDKVHLFRFDNGRERYDEAHAIEPGQTPVAFELTDRAGVRWRVGMSVCYDLRFPELYRELHADLLLVPSAFTHVTGQAHWEPLLRARAIECQCYVLAPAQYGRHDEGGARESYGHSLIVDPWGHVIARASDGTGLALAEVDLERVARVRRAMPVAEHRKL